MKNEKADIDMMEVYELVELGLDGREVGGSDGDRCRGMIGARSLEVPSVVEHQ